MQTVTQALTELAKGETDALTTAEVAERLIVKAIQALDQVDAPSDREQVAFVRALLVAAADETTAHTASAVKDQALSDSIAASASTRVRQVVAAIEAAHAANLAPQPEDEALDSDDENLAEHTERTRALHGGAALTALLAGERAATSGDAAHAAGTNSVLDDLLSGGYIDQDTADHFRPGISS